MIRSLAKLNSPDVNEQRVFEVNEETENDVVNMSNQIEEHKPVLLDVKEQPKRVTFDLNENVPQETSQPESQNQQITWEYDRHFMDWLSSINSSIFISSYKTGLVFSIGSVKKENGENMLSIYYSNLNRPMGMYVDKNKMLIGTETFMIQYKNVGETQEIGTDYPKYDATFVPRTLTTTNDVDMHDVTLDSNGNVYFASALFNCIGKLSPNYSFEPYWKPDWISKIAEEDRCHVNGVCSYGGKPRFVTSCSQSDVKGGWRGTNRVGNGVVVDIVANKVIVDGLTMPHSPRVHNGVLYVLDSGTGWFGRVEQGEDGPVFERKTFIPGFLRGLSFVGNYAIVGSSDDRHENTFVGLPLGERLRKENVDPVCGFHVINLDSFNVQHTFKFNGVKEIYDVNFVEGIKRPKIFNMNDPQLPMQFDLPK